MDKKSEEPVTLVKLKLQEMCLFPVVYVQESNLDQWAVDSLKFPWELEWMKAPYLGPCAHAALTGPEYPT